MKRELRHWAVLIAVSFSIALSGKLLLAATITMSAAAPSTDVILQQLLRDDSSPLDYRSEPQHRFFGQTFTAASDLTLDKISFQIFQEDATRMTNGMTMKVDVFSAASVTSTSGTTIFGSPQTGVTPTFNKGEFLWMTFDVDDVALTQNQVYGFTIDFDFALAAPNNGHLIGNDNPSGVQFVNDNVLADGQFFSVIAGTPSSQSGRDLAFVLQGQGPPPPTVFTPNTTRTETFNAAGLPNQFVEVNNTHDNGDDFGFSNTNNAGGSAGEAGGSFARSVVTNSYSDIDLTDGLLGVFDRTKTLVLSGKGVFTDATTADGNMFVGYTGDGGQQFIGMLIAEPASGTDEFRAKAFINNETVFFNESATVLIGLDDQFEFDLLYTDDGVNDNGIAGDGIGTLFGTINGTSVSVTGTSAFNLASNTFNKFGVGSGFIDSNNPAQTAGAFFDDLEYSIFVVPEPSTVSLAMLGLAGWIANSRRKQTRNIVSSRTKAA